jgi:hypothetical protein
MSTSTLIVGHAILGLWLWLFDMETTVSPPQGQYKSSIRQDYVTDAPDHIRWNSGMGS